jgi:hypothetical protein
MFDDLIDKDIVEERILIRKSLYEAMVKNIDVKQGMINSMIDEIIALRRKIKELESVLDGLNIDSVVP